MADKPGLLTRIADGLANALTGSGTSIDRRMHNRWLLRAMTPMDIEAAYRTSWLMRKVIDLPAEDMVSSGWSWQASNEQIEAIEETEKRLDVIQNVIQALIYGRLGGGLLIMGGPGPATAPMPDDIGKDELRYIKAVSRYGVTLGPRDTDPDSDTFNEPTLFELKVKGGRTVPIHASRCIVFKGKPVGITSATTSDEDSYWGDAVMTAINDAVQNAETAMNEIAALIPEAKIDVFGIPKLMNMVGDAIGEQRIQRRMSIMTESKSIHRAIVRDAEETWEQRQINFSGLPEVIRTFLHIVAGAADIPVTRLLGKSADGMNATGEGDERNYLSMLETKQGTDLAPKLDTLLGYVRQSSGVTDPKVWYQLTPLAVEDPKAEQEREKQWIDGVKVLNDTGLIPEITMRDTIANHMTESSLYPGFEESYEANKDDSLFDDPDPEDVPPALPAPGQGPTPAPGAPPAPQPPTGKPGNTA